MSFFDSDQLNELLVRLKKGDTTALDAIYAMAGSRMFSLAIGILHNDADAEDAVQESFLKLVRAARSFRDGTNGYALIMRIVRNSALDILRKRRNRREEDIDGIFSLTDENYSPERMQRALELEEAMSLLSPEGRRMIYYRYYLDFTVRDIARETGMSKSAVARAIERAEKELKSLLDAGQNGKQVR